MTFTIGFKIRYVVVRGLFEPGTETGLLDMKAVAFVPWAWLGGYFAKMIQKAHDRGECNKDQWNCTALVSLQTYELWQAEKTAELFGQAQ